MSTQTTLDLDCCGPTDTSNPKQQLYQRRRPDRLPMYDVKNPIPGEISDPTDIQDVFRKWNLVPYAGTTMKSGQMLLVWYLMLAQLSPTHNACISKKLKYAVGGKATPTRLTDSEWDVGEQANPMTESEKTAYRDSVNEFIEFEDGISKFHRRIGWSYEATGNAWVEMKYSQTMEQGRVHLECKKVTSCLYLNTKHDEMRVVAISPKWDDAYLRKHEPRYIPLYPNFSQDEDGTMRTMFHLKNGSNDWYGRPESQGSDLYKYREVQDALYLVKQAGANFTGQLIIEVEDDDPEYAPAVEDEKAQNAGFAGFADRFERNYTAKSDDPQSVLITARPYGSKPMFVFQVAPNTNENWYKVTGDISQDKIITSHGCTLRFMGKDAANGFSTDAFVSDYVMNMEPVINELKSEITKFTNDQLTVAWMELLNKPELNDFSVTFMPPIQSSIDNYKNAAVAQPITAQPTMIPNA